MLCARCAREVAAGAQRCPNCSDDPLLDGRYRLDRLLGSDSLGVSYRAVRIDDAMLVRARSCMLRRLPDEPERSTWLARLAELDHPALPRWLEHLVIGERSLATLWLIHEHVTGESLLEALAAAPARRFDQARTVALLRELADVLAYLHDRPMPIVHGGLSPAVVHLRSSGRGVCLLELGSAVATVPSASTRGLADGLAYSAPEQLHGDPTPASDVWALGAIAVVMLSGHKLSELRDTSHRLRWRERIDVAPELVALLERMLELEPTRRITAVQLRNALDGLRSARKPHQPAPPHQPPRPPTAVTRAPKPAADVPIKRPDELSRELSQAHHDASTLAQRQRARLMLARVLVVIVTALVAGLATWLVLH